MNGKHLLLLQAECTLFFEKNPFTIETEQGLALRLGRDKDVLRPALDKLTHISIIKKIGDGELAYYQYNYPDVINEVIE